MKKAVSGETHGLNLFLVAGQSKGTAALFALELRQNLFDLVDVLARVHFREVMGDDAFRIDDHSGSLDPFVKRAECFHNCFVGVGEQVELQVILFDEFAMRFR